MPHNPPLTITRRSPQGSTLNVERLLSHGEFTATVATSAYIDDPNHGPIALSHAPGAATLPDQVPIRVEHKDGLPSGAARDFRQTAGTTTAKMILANRHRTDGLASDIAEGLITDVSIYAKVTEYEITEHGILATRWTPNEISIVGSGADPAATVIRSRNMATEPTTTPTPVPDPVAMHVTRRNEIASLFTGLTGEDWLTMQRDALLTDDPIEVVRSQVMDRLKAAATLPVATNPLVQGGDDASDKTLDGIRRNLEFRSGLVPQDKRREAEHEQRTSEFRGSTLLDCARAYLGSVGYPTKGLNKESLASKALYVSRSGSMGYAAGDFTHLLSDNINKSLAKGYDEAPESWQSWTGRDQASDFREAKRPLLSAFSDLEEVVGTDGEYTYGGFSDKAEVFTLATYGRLMSIGRKALVNDDLSAFSRIPMAMGRAASRKVGDAVYNVLINGQTTQLMNEDGVALFDSTHANLVGSGSGAGPSGDTIGAAWLAMSIQTEQSGQTIQIPPRYWIGPTSLQLGTEVLVAAVHNPAVASGVEPMPPFIGRLNVISDHRLETASSTAWYMAADQGMFDTVLVAFLDGIETPMVEEHDTPASRDGVIYKVRHDFAAYPGDFRGLYKNFGS